MWSDEYKGKKVLITGGLGFIGSNIAHKMTELGAEVTIMDSEIERLGANYHNLLGITDRVRILDEDIRDVEAVNKNVRWADIVFDLAAQVDYKHSDKEPEYDASINILGHQNIIEACRKQNPQCRVIFPGSRTQYGKVTETDLPVKEEHALETTNPPSTYTAHKTTIDMRFTLARRNGFNGVVLRLTNPFGPRAQIRNPSYCVLNYFIGQALQGNPLTVFGEGSQLRDYVFIDDVVEAFAIAGIHPRPTSGVYNIGSGRGVSFKNMAEQIAELTGAEVKTIDYPKEHQRFETGHFYADISRAKQELSWEPRTDFRRGLEKTVQFYKENLPHYI